MRSLETGGGERERNIDWFHLSTRSLVAFICALNRDCTTAFANHDYAVNNWATHPSKARVCVLNFFYLLLF